MKMTPKKNIGAAKGQPGESPKRADRREYQMNLPATVEISTSVMTAPFSMEEAVICGLSRGGLGLMLTIVTTLTKDDFVKLLARRRTCFIHCTVPGSERQLRLFGTIVWTKPKRTAFGTQVRFGVSLEGTDLGELAALEALLEQEAKSESQ